MKFTYNKEKLQSVKRIMIDLSESLSKVKKMRCQLMFERLQVVEDRYEQLNEYLSDPDIVSDATKLRDFSKEQSGLQETVDVYRDYKKVIEELESSKGLLQEKLDDEMEELVKMEIDELQAQVEPLEEKLKILLIPKDPNDDKNVMIEIRGAAGGDEAALFAGNLFRMYSRYAEANHWKIEVIDSSPTELGGFKEVIFMINGNGAYSKLKYENGAHRVQRVPETESGGRTHTSTATVACLPEAEDVDVEIHQKDLKIDTYRSSGAGGQHVNVTDSAVRITHLPTNTVATCQTERSQIKNRERALNLLKSKLYQLKVEEEQARLLEIRGEQKEIGWGSQIRSYVFHPYSMVKDHRTDAETGNVGAVMDGELDPFINAYLRSKIN